MAAGLATSVQCICLITALFGVLFAMEEVSAADDSISFSRDVRPILSQNCFKCHGPDEETREGGLRLDDFESAIGPVDSGMVAIVPGSIDESELVRRLYADEGELMPPESSNLTLTDEEKETLKRWIESGAKYEDHWSFDLPEKTAPPIVENDTWNQQPIDQFIYSALEKRGIAPQPPADPYEQIRRVYLDLTGLPPSVEEADAFASQPTDEAYAQIVDKLLASHDYAERWARKWLDLARYADTNGYEKDRRRTIWPYRDWVVDAIHCDMPYDQFTIEQLAGDMLPNATLDQRIATGFHRNTMLNEEGGIDPLEFRYYAIADRTATTGTIWLGMTIGCAQCHTHKFDPITHDEYFGLFALLNNADEPELPLPGPGFQEKEREAQEQIQALRDALASRYPVDNERTLSPQLPTQASATSSQLSIDEKGIVRVAQLNAPHDSFELVFQPQQGVYDGIRVVALSDETLPSNGPGLTPHGNFVLSEVTAKYQDVILTFEDATADFSQSGFNATAAIDGDAGTGWAIHGEGEWNVDRYIDLKLSQPIHCDGSSKLSLRLESLYGQKHVMGKFQVFLLSEPDKEPDLDQRRNNELERDFEAWIAEHSTSASRWHVAIPSESQATTPNLTHLEDGSVLATGDFSKSDHYRIKFDGVPAGVTGFRLEVIPDDRLPGGGPGAIYYEGPAGDFFLSEVEIRQQDAVLPIQTASQSFANGKNTAMHCIDGDKQSGWSIDGGQRRRHVAFFTLESAMQKAGSIEIEMVCERWYASGIGRFRWSYTTDKIGQAFDIAESVEEILTAPRNNWTAQEYSVLRQEFLEKTPKLSEAHKEIEKLKAQLRPDVSTLVLQERPLHQPRQTIKYHRGEYLQPSEEIKPHTPAVLSSNNKSPNNRLDFARWLVSPDNPLTARVTVNRAWEAFFGYGIVRTSQDFGYQGDMPTHPELLDYLAVDFVENGWSMKRLHKMIVLSQAYRQSSRLDPASGELDPDNRWVSRGNRDRLDAEIIRDQALAVSGLLSKKRGGPSVFPPQPSNVASEGTYGGFRWTESIGEDRYRKSLYTFSKRATPFALSATFDAPSGEACIARREVTNTPLQALTLLNDRTFIEVAQQIGKDFGAETGNDRERLVKLFRLLLIRPPASDELDDLVDYLSRQRERLEEGGISPEAILDLDKSSNDVNLQTLREQAAWTLVSRVLLNLDEAITK